MSEYKFATVDETATIYYSNVDIERVKIWSVARVQDAVVSRDVSIGNETIVVQSTLEEKCAIGRRNIISNSLLEVGTSTQSNTTIRYCCVGKYCAIAWNVTIGAPNNDMHKVAMAELDYIFDGEEHEHLSLFDNLQYSIGNDVWIAVGAHILRDVSISDGAVVAENAVVTQSVPPYAVVEEVPTRIVTYRFPENQIERLKQIKWWDFSAEQLQLASTPFDKEMTDEILDQLELIQATGRKE